MTTLIYAMIYGGSLLMAYNIGRYYLFLRKISGFGEWERMRALAIVPFALLIAFLVGYLCVALFGEPDLVIAGILLGGSIFVSIVLAFIFRIVARLGEANERSLALYNRTRISLGELMRDYLAFFRVNLTRDVIEECNGWGIRPDEREVESYTQLVKLRSRHRVDGTGSTVPGPFTPEALLERFKAGQTSLQDVRLRRMTDTQIGFVKTQAAIVEEPGTGDILAFITELPCNDEMMTEALLDKALIGQYDMIASLIDGRYRVLIGEGSGKPGTIFPRETDGGYMDYLAEQVAPVIVGPPEEKIAIMSSLGLARVERELAEREPYTVDITYEVDGEVYDKRFVFYVVDAAMHFYLLLKQDTTELRRTEIERNRQLEAALEEARQASKSKTIFLSNMSHDIRTPMNAIVGYTDFARKSHDDAQVHEYLDKIDASSKHLLALINDVLEMSRIESGKIDLEPEPVNLAEAATGVRDMFVAQVAEKHIEFTVSTERLCNANVLCDKHRLNRVVLNLLSNAFKFTPENGHVSLTFEQTTPAAGGFANYELRVKDDGIGMSPEFAERVFDAFERERTSTVSGLQGTGLGMAITKRIVDMMGGTITVDTAPGAGTEFTVRLRLPLLDPNATGCDVQPGDDAARAPHAATRDFCGMRALLVEDNEINREIARLMLESMGFELDEAVNGQEALERLTAAGAGRYDVVITDIQMPVMDGFETTRAIRALPDAALAGMPIIAMSANAFQEDVQAAREAGVDGYVAKPIDIDQLAATLASVLA